MDDSDFDGIMAGLGDALDHVLGNEHSGRVVRSPDVRAIRQATKLSQQAFARTYRLRVSTLRDWEQGRRQPDTGNAVLLRMIAADPLGVQAILAKA